MLEQEIKYFEKNKSEFLRLYKDKFLLIKEDKLIGSFDTEEQAYNKSLSVFGNSDVLIKQVLDRENNVSFSSLYFGINNAGI